MRCGTHYAAADFTESLEHVARTLARKDVVHTGNHAGGNHSTGLQRASALRAFGQRESECTERAVTYRGNAAADELVIDVAVNSHFVQGAPVAHRIADDDAPVVAEVRDDRAHAERIQRRERAARNLDTDAQLADEVGRFVERPVDLVTRSVAA